MPQLLLRGCRQHGQARGGAVQGLPAVTVDPRSTWVNIEADLVDEDQRPGKPGSHHLGGGDDRGRGQLRGEVSVRLYCRDLRR